VVGQIKAKQPEGWLEKSDSRVDIGPWLKKEIENRKEMKIIVFEITISQYFVLFFHLKIQEEVDE